MAAPQLFASLSRVLRRECHGLGEASRSRLRSLTLASSLVPSTSIWPRRHLKLEDTSRTSDVREPVQLH